MPLKVDLTALDALITSLATRLISLLIQSLCSECRAKLLKLSADAVAGLTQARSKNDSGPSLEI